MLCAVWYQAWGLIAARDGDGSAWFDDIFGRSRSQLIPSWLANTVCLLLPAIPSVAASIIGAIGDAHLEHSRHEWYDWHSKYDGAPELTRDMVLDAQNIFHASIRGAYHVCVSQAIWGTMCLIFGPIHIFATTSLILSIGSHLRAKRRAVLEQTSRIEPEELPTHASVVAAQISRNDYAFRLRVAEGEISKPPRSMTHDSMSTDDQLSRIETKMFTFGERMHSQHTSFFPAIEKPSNPVRIKASQAEIVLAFFAIQSVTIILGFFALLTDSLYMAVHSYAAAEANKYESAFTTGFITVAIITVLAGTGSFISLTHTTFELDFAALLYSRRFEPGRSDTSSIGREKPDFLNMD
ncbi:unnamed protein product [Tilletia caries]|nr:unnamed protein product [Tilletia caries]